MQSTKSWHTRWITLAVGSAVSLVLASQLPGQMGGMSMGMGPGRGLPGTGPGLIMPEPLAQEAQAAQYRIDSALARYAQTEDKTERQAIRAELTKALEQQFEIQQKWRMSELAEIESRVQKLRALIDKRNQAKPSIVATRCNQLLDELDGLGWTSPDGMAFPGAFGGGGMGGVMPGMMGGMPGSAMGAGMGGGMMGGYMPGSSATGSYGGVPGSPAYVLPGAFVPPGAAEEDASDSSRVKLRNDLKRIGVALHNFNDTHRALPPAFRADDHGSPLLSWRVLILPYLGQEALYREFHLDEPWDSEHNRQLIDRMPETYRLPGAHASPGMTSYLTVRAPNTAFPGQESSSFADITDGTSNTVMVVAVSDERAVVWTSPQDLTFDQAAPLADLTSAHSQGLVALLCDGSVVMIRSPMEAESIRRLILCNDGHPLPEGSMAPF